MIQDNQNVAIIITVNAETREGQNWEGTVELSGPFDDSMVERAVTLSKELTCRGLKHSHEAVVEAVNSVPSRPSKRRAKAQDAVNTPTVEAEVPQPEEPEVPQPEEPEPFAMAGATVPVDDDDEIDDLPF